MTLWRTLPDYAPYEQTLARMEETASAIFDGREAEQVWALEHPALFTAGTSAKPRDLVAPDRFPVHKTGRGGQYTYHGPGQRVCYVMMNLNSRKKDVRLFVATLQQWIINTLAVFNIRGEKRDGRVGVWVVRPDKIPQLNGEPHEDKIAAIGIRIRRWVTYHGISLNVEPELEHYSGIVPCGLGADDPGLGVTSLVDLGLPVTMEEIDFVLRGEFEKLFGPVKSSR